MIPYSRIFPMPSFLCASQHAWLPRPKAVSSTLLTLWGSVLSLSSFHYVEALDAIVELE